MEASSPPVLAAQKSPPHRLSRRLGSRAVGNDRLSRSPRDLEARRTPAARRGPRSGHPDQPRDRRRSDQFRPGRRPGRSALRIPRGRLDAGQFDHAAHQHEDRRQRRPASPDPAAPVSPLLFDGRTRTSPSSAPADSPPRGAITSGCGASAARPIDGRPLWLASASFDRGVELSRYTLQVTHRIGPDLDAERGFVGQSLRRRRRDPVFLPDRGDRPDPSRTQRRGRSLFHRRRDRDRRACARLRPDARPPVAPPRNPPQIDIRSAIIHALGEKR